MNFNFLISQSNEFGGRRKDSSMFKLFIKNICIKLTSIKSEQTWSKTSLINLKKRAKMVFKNLKQSIFINMNFKLCEQVEIEEQETNQLID